MKHFLFSFAACLIAASHVQVETLVACPLAKPDDLAQWTICCWKSAKGPRPEIRKDADGKGFLYLGAAPRGLFLPLAQPVVLTPDVKKLSLRVEVRPADPARPVRPVMALTSREKPDPKTLQPFRHGADSGILATGYQFNRNFAQHLANYIQARRNGSCIKALSAEGNTGFLKPGKIWQTWVLEYDARQKLLSLKTDTASPAAQLHQTDLTGETMRAVWLSGDYEFRNVQLDLEK